MVSDCRGIALSAVGSVSQVCLFVRMMIQDHKCIPETTDAARCDLMDLSWTQFPFGRRVTSAVTLYQEPRASE